MKIFTLGVVGLLLLSSCGFHLRGTQGSVVPMIGGLHLSSSDEYSEILQSLRRTFVRAKVNVVEARNDADYSLMVFGERNSRRAIATTSNISAAEYELRQEVDIQLRASDGHQLIPRVTISAQRVYSFDAANLESSAEEETLLREEMRRDLNDQIFRRVNTSISSFLAR